MGERTGSYSYVSPDGEVVEVTFKLIIILGKAISSKKNSFLNTISDELCLDSVDVEAFSLRYTTLLGRMVMSSSTKMNFLKNFHSRFATSRPLKSR